MRSLARHTPTHALCALALSLFALASAAMAGDDSSSAAADKATVVAFVKKYTYALKKPVYSYHWFHADPNGRGFNGKFGAADPIGLNYVNSTSQSFWRFRDQKTTSMYGVGLYAAADPVVTRTNYGGVGSWTLVEMKLPAGFRALDLQKDGAVALPREVSEALRHLGCPRDAAYSLSTMVQYSNVDRHPEKCDAAMKEILDDTLKIDGFTYSYISAWFSECASGNAPKPRRKTAFVITSNRWVTPDSVRMFNANTSDDPEDRARIMSLFYKYGSDLEAKYSGSQKASKVPYPAKLSQESFKSLATGTNGFLWSDLQDKDADPELGSWIRQNLYGCSDDEPFEPAPEPPVAKPVPLVPAAVSPEACPEIPVLPVSDLPALLGQIGIIVKEPQ